MPTGQMSEVLRRLCESVRARDGAGLSDGQLLESFIARRDEIAFEALVRRHGPMVLAVCRRVTGNEQDAEDSFQATFLVLVRKAASLGAPELVGNWLYGVAYRTALKAGTASARRHAQEKQVRLMPQPKTEAEDIWLDLQPLLDRELNRLPDKYRVPVVLCELEGRTRKEVARRLRIPEGTLSSRLATARKMLARRLARQGLAISGSTIGCALTQKSAAACLPTSLVNSTVKGAALIASGQVIAKGIISIQVAALTEGVLKAMFLTKLKVALGVILVIGIIGLGTGLLARPTLAALMEANPQPPKALAQDRDKEKDQGHTAPAVKVRNTSKTDKEKIQGPWGLMSVEFNGQDVTKNVGDIKMVFKGDQIGFTTKFLPADVRLTYKLDPAQKPKSVDFTFKNLSQAETMKGIYELKDDALKLCVHVQAPKAADRPREFKTEAESSLCLFVLKRQKVEGNQEPKAEKVPPAPKPADSPKAADKPPTKAEGIVFLLNEELAMIQPDGKDFTRLPSKAKHIFWFHVSPDGKRLAYTTTNAVTFKGRFHTFVTDLFSESSIIGNISRLAGNDLPEGDALDGEVECAVWSADGTKLACCDPKARNHSIVDVKTGEKSPVNLPEGHWLHDWSPDGNWFLTTKRYEDTGDNLARVYLVKKDGSEIRCLNGSIQNAWFPRFSPDGHKVLFVSLRKASRVYVLDLADGKPRPVSPELNAVVYSACWSPDGKRIAYAWHQVPANPDSDDPVEYILSVIDADGKNSATLRTEKGRLGPSVHVDWR